MRKFVLIAAMILVSATAEAGQSRSLITASADEPLQPKPSRPRRPNQSIPRRLPRRPRLRNSSNEPAPSMPRRRQIAASQAPGLPGPTSPGTRIIGPRRASPANCIATAFIGKREQQNAPLDFERVVIFVLPGWCVSTRPQMRNCASGNLEILRCAIAHHSSMLRIAPE